MSTVQKETDFRLMQMTSEASIESPNSRGKCGYLSSNAPFSHRMSQTGTYCFPCAHERTRMNAHRAAAQGVQGQRKGAQGLNT